MPNKKLAILIGNSKFEAESDLVRLRCPPNDVDGLHEVLADSNCGDFEEVISLKEKDNNRIIVEINRLYERANPGDIVLIYYSGHGKLDVTGQLYLAASDTHSNLLVGTALAIRRLIDIMRNYGRVSTVLILDCCFSGAVEDYVYRGSVTDQLTADTPGHGTFIMASSNKYQVAKEAKTRGKYGVFTKHLIQGLKSGAADRNKDGYIGAQELFKYVHEKVTSSSDQKPIKVDKISSGELFLAKTEQNMRKKRKAVLKKQLLDWSNKDLITNDAISVCLKLLDVRTKALVHIEDRWMDDLLDDLFRKDVSVAEFNTHWLTARNSSSSEFEASDSRPFAAGIFAIPAMSAILELVYSASWLLGCALLSLYVIPAAILTGLIPSFLGLPAIVSGIVSGMAFMLISGLIIVGLRHRKLTSVSVIIYGIGILLSTVVIFSLATRHQFGSPMPGVIAAGFIGASIGYLVFRNWETGHIGKKHI